MLANYHTHTWRCNHAAGTERQYVENALTAGLRILGFSDHSPYFFPGDYYSNFRMRPEQFPDYVETVLKLREEYKGQIQIPLGLELEFYPKFLPGLLPMLKDSPLDYLILGQHFIGNEIESHYNGWPTDQKKLLEAYVNQSLDAFQTGLFTYFAHPDLMRFEGEDGFYRAQMRRLCREARECGMVLEVNLLGLRSRRNYPDWRFWEIAAGEGCTAILGRDAHEPEALLDDATERKARKRLQALGITLVDTMELKDFR